MSRPTRDEFVSAIARIAESVYDFHSRFDKPIPSATQSSEEYLITLRNRLPLIIEELGEHAQDLNKGNLEDAALEIADVTFVAVGTILSLESVGVYASCQVAKKNDDKTHETHVIEESSGKLVRRQ